MSVWSRIVSFVKTWPALMFFGGLALYVVVKALQGSNPQSSALGALSFLAGLLIIVSVFVLVFRFFRRAIKPLFFKVRNRIIANYILTGILPLCLIFVLIWIGVTIFMVQLVSFYFEQVMDKEFDTLENVAQGYSFLLSKEQGNPRAEALQAVLKAENAGFPELQVTVFDKGPEKRILWSSGEKPIPQMEVTGPLSRNFIVIQDQVFMVVTLGGGSRFSDYPVEAVVPLKEEYRKKIAKFFDGFVMFDFVFEKDKGAEKEEKGRTTVRLSFPEPPSSGGIEFEAGEQTTETVAAWSKTLPTGLNYLTSYLVQPCLYFGKEDGGKKSYAIGIVRTKYTFMFNKFLQGGLPESIPARKIILWLVIVIAGLFAFVELIALIISVVVSLSITKIVSQLHEKAVLISKGDFSYRIRSKRKDQLGELADSFDKMSEDVQKLLVEAKEKERLDKEIAIAREVQRAFFPRKVPSISELALFGRCMPARMVSGDYYDFIHHEEGILDFFVGDISGKGISAALLMASSQTFLRLEAAKRPLPQVAHILSHYNDYLAEHSAVEKYCTLFYGRIHTRRRTLTFCNAGHPPPFLFRKTNSLRLATGGRVAGLFRDTEFQEETMDLEKGDLLVVFTDGFTEVFNGSEEEFGEERLGDLIRKARKAELEALFERIVAATRDWSGSEDQADDMTMVIIEMEREARAASDGDRAGIIGS